MLEYIVLTAAIIILSLVGFNKFTKKCQKPVTLVFLAACFLMLLAVSALRLNTGWDYTMYTRGFFQMAHSGFDTLEYRGWEYGFNILTKIIAFFTKDQRVYIAVVSVICLAGPFYVILRYSKKPWLSVLLYINLYFFYCSMNFLRQSIAISVIMFAYTFLLDRKLLRYVIFVALAACFHVTALVMLPVYFLVKPKASFKIPLLYCILFIWIYISSNATLDLIAEYFRTDYSESVFFARGLSFVHIIIPSVILTAGMTILFSGDAANSYILQQPDKRGNGKTYGDVINFHNNLMYFSYLWIIVMLRHSILERFSYYTYTLAILYIPELINFADMKFNYFYKNRLNKTEKTEDLSDAEKEKLGAAHKKRRDIMRFSLVFAVVAITVLYNIYGLAAYERGVHGVYPYQSWFSFNFT